jgi:hypothetical protein
MELRTEVEIDAPPALVWEVLTDTASYHEWNPFVQSIEGTLAAGQRVSVLITPPESSDYRFRPEVIRVVPEEEIRWRGKLLFAFLFSGEHFFQLKALPDGRTRFVHGEDFTGLLLGLLGRKLTLTARGFVFMNQALKKRVESLRPLFVAEGR